MSNINTLNSVEIETVVSLVEAKYTELVTTIATDRLLELLPTTGSKLTNKAEYTLILTSLRDSMSDYSKVVSFTTKLIVASAIREVPRTVLISQVAETLTGRKASNRFRIASAIVRLLELSGAFTTYQKTNTHGFSESVITLGYTLSTMTQDELSTKIRNLPTDLPVAATKRTAGHSKKVTAENSHMLPITQKLNDVAYTLDARVWNKFKYELATYRFSDTKTQEAMIKAGDELLGKTFYFGHRFGPDNGRIYVDGDLFTLHGGALNYAFKFANTEVCTTAGLNALSTKVEELHSQDTLAFKEQVELYSLGMDLIDAEAGLPVGTILHIDAKLSGLQHQSIALRDATGAHFCGLLDDMSDGYNHIRSNLSNASTLTRDIVKKAFNPYQYGAGSAATVAPVIKAGASLDFKEWELAYKKAFPKAYDLRSFLLSIAKNYKSETYSFTSPSGYNCTLTGLGTVDTAIDTCYGRLEYSRQEVDADFMGVKIVAAFSHMLDASALHSVVLGADFDMHVIHDSFGSHPNNTASVHALYIESLQNHLCTNVLENFTSDILSSVSDIGLVQANVARLMSNTLRPSYIVGGLF